MKYGSGSLEHDHKTALDYTVCPSFVLILKEAQVNACGMKRAMPHTLRFSTTQIHNLCSRVLLEPIGGVNSSQ